LDVIVSMIFCNSLSGSIFQVISTRFLVAINSITILPEAVRLDFVKSNRPIFRSVGALTNTPAIFSIAYTPWGRTTRSRPWRWPSRIIAGSCIRARTVLSILSTSSLSSLLCDEEAREILIASIIAW